MLSLFRRKPPARERIETWFRQEPGRQASGAQISKALSMWSGTLYPGLIELERDGVIVSDWAWPTPFADGRPRRRMYRLADATSLAA